MAVCALCWIERDLVVSHIIPRFVGKRQKADAPKPFLRDISNPNRRVQDVPKKELLCRECEQSFSNYEDPFSRDIFTPTMDGVRIDDLVVTRDHHRFSASVFWRSMVMMLEHRNEPESEYTQEDWSRLEEVEVAMREFLFEEREHPEDVEYYLFNARFVTEAEFPGINALVNLTTGPALRYWHERPDRIMIIFMNGLLQITPLRSTPESRQEWDGSWTRIRGGALWRNFGQQINDGVFGTVLVGLAQEMVKQREHMSPPQQRLVGESMKNIDVAKWIKTPHGEAVLQDYFNERRRSE